MEDNYFNARKCELLRLGM